MFQSIKVRSVQLVRLDLAHRKHDRACWEFYGILLNELTVHNSSQHKILNSSTSRVGKLVVPRRAVGECWS